MDQKRLFVAIVASLAILFGFQYLVAPHLKPPSPAPAQVASKDTGAATPAQGAQTGNTPAGPTDQATQAVPANVPRVKINAPRVAGSLSLLGARLDDLTLTQYRETLAPDSPDVRLLGPLSGDKPYYVQYGWTAAPDQTLKLPGNDTVWSASADTLSPGKPVTLSWDNGAGLTFQIALAVDDDYMFTVTQSVKNATDKPVSLFPCSIRLLCAV